MIKSMRKKRKLKNTLVLILFGVCFLAIYYVTGLSKYVFPVIGEAMVLFAAYLGYQVYLYFLYQSSNFYLLATKDYKNNELKTLLYLLALAVVFIISVLTGYMIVGFLLLLFGFALLMDYHIVWFKMKLGLILAPYLILFNTHSDIRSIIFWSFLVGCFFLLQSFKFKQSNIFEFDGECIFSDHQLPIFLHQTDQSLEVSETSIEVIDADDVLFQLNNISVAPNDIPGFIDWVKRCFSK